MKAAPTSTSPVARDWTASGAVLSHLKLSEARVLLCDYRNMHAHRGASIWGRSTIPRSRPYLGGNQSLSNGQAVSHSIDTDCHSNDSNDKDLAAASLTSVEPYTECSSKAPASNSSLEEKRPQSQPCEWSLLLLQGAQSSLFIIYTVSRDVSLIMSHEHLPETVCDICGPKPKAKLMLTPLDTVSSRRLEACCRKTAPHFDEKKNLV